MNLTTTLSIIRAHNPCSDGWAKLIRHLGPDWPYDRPIPFSTILESNGINDALWALRAVSPEYDAERDRLARLFACDCAEGVLPIFEGKYPNDRRPRQAIEVARAFANGKATQNELYAALDAAWDAAGAAAWAAAWAAARAAAWAAERYAAWAAERYAAWDAEVYAADAAWYAADAARDAAGNSAIERQTALFKTYFCT